MSTSTTSGGGGGVGGALSLMGCVREASPPPQSHHLHHHHHHQQQHHQQQQQHRAFGLGEFPAQHSVDPLPKEPKKRRFHPLRGLRKIFRRKSRGAADARLVSNSADRDAELARLPREDITMRHPAGRPEEARSRSASELLTDSCDRESVFLRRGGTEDNFMKLRGGAGKLSVSHDSVFPGEVPHTRPLSSLASLTTLERRQARKSNEIIEHKEYNHHVAQRHRISLRVLEQIKTVIENRNQLASTTSPDAAPSIAHIAGERYQQETTENRFSVFEKHERSSEESHQQVKPGASYEQNRSARTCVSCAKEEKIVIRLQLPHRAIMVVSHREPSISSNIRAIIEQLNLNPVERRRLIDRTRQENSRCKSYPDRATAESPPKISIGVYGCKDRDEFTIQPSQIKPVRRIDSDRSRSKAETRQRVIVAQVKKETCAEHANEGKFVYHRPTVTIGSFDEDDSRSRMTTATTVANKISPSRGQRIIKRADPAIEVSDASVVSMISRPSYKIEDRLRSKQPDNMTGKQLRRNCDVVKEQTRAEDTAEVTRSSKDTLDRTVPVAKEDLPQLESASLSHNAAHHRISVRPKNRRPPRRPTPTTSANVSGTPSIPPTIAEDTLDSLDQHQQQQSTSNASSPTEPKTIGVTRKSSSRLSRNSDIFEELESRLPRKPSASSLSPDSLDATMSTSRSSAEMVEEQTTPTTTTTTEVIARSVARRPSNRISKGSSDIFEELETKVPRSRRSSNRLSKSPDSLDSVPCWFSKSTEGFDKYGEADYEEPKPVIRRLLLNPISKSSDRVSKSSDSLEAIEPLASDDSIDRRRSSFELRARRGSKAMSKSSENFDMLEREQSCANEEMTISQELQKRSSISDISLTRGRRLSKNISKSSESFERIDTNETKEIEAEIAVEDVSKSCCRRSSKRMSSESSDNLDVEDRLENRRVRRTPKRLSSTGIVDAVISGDDREGERRPTPTRKPPRLQKSSESSELGSTDTLDSEKRNKSSESTETLDSLEKDLEQDRKDEEITDSVVDKREKNDSWSSRNVAATDSDQTSMGDDTEDSKSLISTDKYYWRQTSEPKENLGIHQLLAITIVTRMADNGNNQRSSVIYPKKKQQMSTSQPTSPVAKQEDTKMLFDNLLVGKNDEDLQNMLNGNISEVSTDTKSFKEKLIMFEKLGK